MIDQLRNVWQSKEVLYYLVRYQLKAQNKNKILGFLWSFLDPLLLWVVYYIMVDVIFQRGEPKFPVLLFCALIAWMWFSRSLASSVTSVTSKYRLVQTVRFPLAILPLTGVISELLNWFFGFVILLPLLFIFEADITINILWLPVLLLIQLVLTIGACFILAVLGTYLSDLTNIVQFALRLWMYLSPILYTASTRIPEKYQKIYMIVNPFGGLMESYKNILVLGSRPNYYIAAAAVMAIVVFVVGLWYFARDEHKLVKAI